MKNRGAGSPVCAGRTNARKGLNLVMKKCCLGALLVLAFCLLASCAGSGEPQDAQQSSAPQETVASESVSEYADVSSDGVSDSSCVSDVPSGTVSDASFDVTSALSGNSSEDVSEESSDASSVGMNSQASLGSTSHNGANSVSTESSEEPVKPVHRHSYEGASCTEGGVCSCGKVGEPLGHQMTEATCSQPATCSRCGQTEGEALTHEYKNGYCKYCKDTNGPLSPEEAKLFNRSNKLTDAQNAEALKVARQIAEQVLAMPVPAEYASRVDLFRVEGASKLVYSYRSQGTYTTEGPNYAHAYGVFIAKEFSCAGTARAMGLVLSCMGYEWTHVNENQWKHQWPVLEMDGQIGWADAMMGWAGYGEYTFFEEGE